MNTNPATDPQSGKTSPSARALSFWWLLLAILLVWNFSGLLFQSSEAPVATLPYSEFIDQVKHDNVSVVRIAGSKIGGTFLQPVSWPPARLPAETASAVKSQAAPAGASPVPGGTAGKSAKVTASEPLRKPPAGWPFGSVSQQAPANYEAFITTFPETVGDPRLVSLLETHGVQITADQPDKHWLSMVLLNILPFALLMGFFWWMGRRAMNQQSSLFGIRNSHTRRFDSEQARESFDDVAGADAAKQQLQEEVDFLRNPGKYHALGARIPRGVLLVGPPGTGKTLMARAVAGEAGVPFFSISGSEFVEMFVGVGASRVRDAFQQAKQAAPAILFVDELDAVGRRRGAGLGMVNDEREQTLNQMLVEMDGFDAREKVIVIAATNRPDVLDPALLRPGRFDRQVVVDLPDARGREGILRIHTGQIKLSDDVDLGVIAGITIGMSGAQLASLCNEAALFAAREGHDKVQHTDFEAALDKLVLGDIRPLVLNEKTRRVIACHESGHALVAWLTADADPVHKVTIVPHGQALGVTEQRPGADPYNLPKSYLLARMAVLLGGRVAEELVTGDATTGAENDLLEATRLAQHMVTAWGMSELGLAAYQSGSENRFLGYELGRERTYSESTAAAIDREVKRLLDECHQTVTALLKRERDKLERLADHLLAHEAANTAQLTELLGPRPRPPTGDAGRTRGKDAATRVAACCMTEPGGRLYPSGTL
ncbi:MAG: ATP-dependent zinc metalloprotease FtsH [Gammaproteobacteria bacterium]